MKYTQRSFRPLRVIMLISSLLLVIAFGGGSIYAQQPFWEGRITTAPYGLLPNSGLYAASNAFPVDTKVVITHPDDGSTLEVRVVERLKQERVFMQVSTEAADKLGLKKNEILTARVSPVAGSNNTVEQQIASETPFSRDPDINPSAGVEGERRSLIEEYLAEQDVPAEEPEPAKPVLEPIKPEPEIAELPEASEDTGPTSAVPEENAVAESETEPEEAAAAVTPEPPAAMEPVLRSVSSMPEASLPEEVISVPLPAPVKITIPESLELADTEPADMPETAAEAPEPVTGPIVVSIEPVFLREKDRSYSPTAPTPPAGKREKGTPLLSIDRLIPSEVTSPGDYMVKHLPLPPAADKPSADLRIASTEEAAPVELAPLHSPERDMKIAEAEPPVEDTPPKVEDAGPIIEDAGPKSPVEIPEDAELVLIPAEERPPVGPPTVEETELAESPAPPESPKTPEVVEAAPREEIKEDAEIEDVKTSGLAVKENLEANSYYLQVAAYRELELARVRALGLARHYPITIYSDRGAVSAPYKLMIGPLNEDESGTLLFTFTSRGYPDAFIRRGN